ncbi:hypothetical protein THASP1DRAFT_32637, partial [Thamnocephalis sphaerospora]
NPADFYIAVTSGKVRSSLTNNFHPTDLFTYWERHQQNQEPFTSIYDDQKFNRMEMLEEHTVAGVSGGPRGGYGHARNDTEARMADDSFSYEDDRETMCGTAFAPIVRCFGFTREMGAATRTAFVDCGMYIKDIACEFRSFLVSAIWFWQQDPVRPTPNVAVIFLLCFKRACMQIYRSRGQFLKGQMLHLGCGAFISLAARQFDYLGRQPESICQLAPAAMQSRCREPTDHIADLGVFLSLGCMFAGINVGAATFGNEKTVFWRDTSAGMNTIPYFAAKVMADLPRCVIAAFCFSLSFVMFYPYRSHYIYIFGTIVLLYFVAFNIGYFISAVVSKETVGLVSTAFALAWAIVFSGVIPDLSDVMHDESYDRVRWLWQVSAPRYATEAVFIKEVGARPFPEIREDRLAHEYNLNNYFSCLIAIVVIGMGWQFLALLFMKLMNRDKMK